MGYQKYVLWQVQLYVGGDPHQLPHRRLDVIRCLQPPKGEKDMPYAELNSLYHHVLSNVDNIEVVLGILIVVNPTINDDDYAMYSTYKMDNWLSWQSGESKACLSQFASIIECNTAGDISILHASLSDFLLDPTRSQQFYLCRESILGDNAALGLRHLREEHDEDGASILPARELILQLSICCIPDFCCYLWITNDCIEAGPCCTPQLQEELSQLSFPTLHSVSEVLKMTHGFWCLSEEIIEMLDKQVSRHYSNRGESVTNWRQGLLEQFTHLISDFQALCFQTVSISNGELILLIYEVQHSHIRQVEASNPTSVFALVFDTEYNESYGRVFKTLFTKHPQYHRLDFTGQHYTTVAEYFMEILYPLYVFGCKSCYSYANQCHYFSLYQNADEFHIAEDTKKRNHSKTLLALLYIAHLLPLACMSEHILGSIFSTEYTESGRHLRNFHVEFTLDGWNDDIIQPARDTVLDYYKHQYFRTFLVGLSGLFGSLTGSRVQRVHELKSTHELFFNISM